jgi:hypothetical protein
MAGFLDVVTPTTIANFAKGAWDGVSQMNPCLQMLKENADWNYDQGGDSTSDVLEGGRHTVLVSAPGMDMTPYLQARNRWARWNLPWAEIAAAVVYDAGALRRNSGPQALYSIRDKDIPAMIRDILYGATGSLGWQFLNQNILAPTGPNAANGLPVAGIPSVLLAPGSTDIRGENNNVYTGVAVAASDRGGVPGTGSQTYAGLSMAPIGSNGVGTGGIAGVDNNVYDAWTPSFVNSTSTAWSGAANVDGNILLYTQYAANRARRFSAGDVSLMPQYGMLDFRLFQAMGVAVAAKQTIFVTGESNKKTSVSNPSLGTMTDVIPHAGLLWRWSEKMPTNTGYVLNFKQMRVFVQPLADRSEKPDSGTIIPTVPTGEDAGILETNVTFDPIRRQYLVTSAFPGQIKIHPRYQVRIGAYA